MTVWMYYTTDGDSGYYRIKLFSTKVKAERYKIQEGSAYGNIKEIEVE